MAVEVPCRACLDPDDRYLAGLEPVHVNGCHFAVTKPVEAGVGGQVIDMNRSLTPGRDEVSGKGEGGGSRVLEGKIHADHVFLRSADGLGQGEGLADGEAARSREAEAGGASLLVRRHVKSTDRVSVGIAEGSDRHARVLVQEEALLIGSEMKEQCDALDTADIAGKEILGPACVHGLLFGRNLRDGRSS